MKNVFVATLASALLLAAGARVATAQPAESGYTDDRHPATGLVKKIEREPARVTIQHGPVKSLGWPGMTMGFGVQDTAILDRLKVGQKIDFEFVQDGKRYLIVRVK